MSGPSVELWGDSARQGPPPAQKGVLVSLPEAQEKPCRHGVGRGVLVAMAFVSRL